MTLSTATPTILTDPGYLLWAPIGSTEPTTAVTASVFSDSWDVAWLSLGATEDGAEFSYSTEVEAVSVAEFFDPIRYSTTGREGTFAFNLADYTMTNVKRAFNGGTLTVTGSTTTTLTKYEPPTPGNEVRAMIGWESLDHTVRLICRQVINAAEITSAFKKAPSYSVLPCNFRLEKPSSAQPFVMWGAGTSRG